MIISRFILKRNFTPICAIETGNFRLGENIKKALLSASCKQVTQRTAT